MYRAYYAKKDTTLYERYPEQNTGIDQILELTKIASGSRLNGLIQAKTYNSRFILDFGSEMKKRITKTPQRPRKMNKNIHARCAKVQN